MSTVFVSACSASPGVVGELWSARTGTSPAGVVFRSLYEERAPCDNRGVAGGAAGDEQPGDLTRRQFGRATIKAGMAAGAAIWVAPQLSSVALAQDAVGSPPPTAPSSTRPAAGDVTGGQAARRDAGRGAGGAAGVPAAGRGAPAGASAGGGALPVTGAESRKLAAIGGAAVLTGSAIIAGERLAERTQLATAAEGSGDETARPQQSRREQ
jgi:hypothetical protein